MLPPSLRPSAHPPSPFPPLPSPPCPLSPRPYMRYIDRGREGGAAGGNHWAGGMGGRDSERDLVTQGLGSRAGVTYGVSKGLSWCPSGPPGLPIGRPGVPSAFLWDPVGGSSDSQVSPWVFVDPHRAPMGSQWVLRVPEGVPTRNTRKLTRAKKHERHNLLELVSSVFCGERGGLLGGPCAPIGSIGVHSDSWGGGIRGGGGKGRGGELPEPWGRRSKLAYQIASQNCLLSILAQLLP